MKLFHFYRVEDQSGVSGTGAVVEGVQFTNGWCALRWISNQSSMCFYRSIEEVKAIHGHGGRTEVVIHDLEPLTQSRYDRSEQRFEVLMAIIEEAARITAYDPAAAADLGGTPITTYIASIGELRRLVDRLERDLGLGPAQQPRSA